MYIGSQNLLKEYDNTLLHKGYTIEELIDKASDCLYDHFDSYKSIGILVGPGNNGGDGLSLAIKLFQSKHQVSCYYIADREKLSQGCRYYFDQANDLKIPMIQINESTYLKDLFDQHDVIADAFFGFGLHSAPRGLYQSVIESINTYYTKDIIAIDIPTGLNCNTGVPYSTVLFATKTISLTALKEGYLNPESQIVTGEVVVEELDIENVFNESGLYELVETDFIKNNLKDRKFDGYKNYYGVDLLFVGSEKYRGAALLSAKGCVNAGAGIVNVMSVDEVNNILPIVLPEAIPLSRPNRIEEEDLNYDAILLGCGLGMDFDAHQYVIDIIQKSTCPLVIDADGLNILSKNLRLIASQHRPIVLTPHIGEFKRLTHVSSDDDLMDKAIEFAKNNHVILVLKGPYTIVTNGIENYRIASGNKAMSVAGMGDTLAGIITSFLGQKYDPMIAVILGVYIHGFTGDLLAKKRYTVLPELLSESIPQAMKILSSKD